MSDTFLKIDITIYRLTTNYKNVIFYLGCMPGYSGVNCSFSCPYPLYGIECQRSCNCIRDLCDVSTGCINYNKGKW